MELVLLDISSTNQNQIWKINSDITEKIQQQLIQFTTNQNTEDEMKEQADILEKTIRSFL